MSGLCVHKSLRSNNNLFTRYESAVYNTRLSDTQINTQIMRDTDSYQGFKIKLKHHLTL